MKKFSKRKKNWIERTIANDRSNKRFLYNRFYLFALLVLLQLACSIYLLTLFVYNSRWAIAIQVVLAVLTIVSVLHIINENDRPVTKLNWILVIFIVPVFGVPFYILYGGEMPIRRMKKKYMRSEEENNRRIAEKFGAMEVPIPNARADGISYYLQKHVGYPAYADGDIRYYKSGEEMFPAILEELKKAEKFILLEYFIIAPGKMWGEILKILLQKAEEGVQIRILYDDFGSMTTLPPNYEQYLESLHKNIRAYSFNQVVPLFDLRMNNRDHRKIIVVDGKVAFTGGINLADEYIGEKRRFGYWKDSGVRVVGSAVASFTRMFFNLWNAFYPNREDIAEYVAPSFVKEGGTAPRGALVQPYDDVPLDKKCVAEHVYMDIINRAVKYVYIFTPYLMPGDILRTALIKAAERGVDVRIVTPGIPDKAAVYRMTRANYGALLEAGVKIYEYTPGFIHSKSIVCDGECAVVGTINFDYRSLYMHFEDGVYFTGSAAVKDVERDCEETFAVSRLCTKENTKRGVVGKLVDSVLRVFESLM